MKRFLLTLILLFSIGAGLKAQCYKYNVTYTNTVQYESDGHTALTGAAYNLNMDSTYYNVMDVWWLHNESTATSNGYYCSTQTSGMETNWNPLIFTPYNNSNKCINIRVTGDNGYDETQFVYPYNEVTFLIPKDGVYFDIFVSEYNWE